MAAQGPNWKRPWQDDGSLQGSRLDFPEPTLRNSNSSSLPVSDEGVRNEPSAEQTPKCQSAAKDEHSGTARQSAYYELINGSNERDPSAHSPPILSSKRARLDAAKGDEREHEQKTGPRQMSQYAPHRLGTQTGYLEPRVTKNRPQQQAATRQEGFLSLVGPSPYEPIPTAAQRPPDMSAFAGNHGLIREDTNRNCWVCDKARLRAPEIANGLQRLHRQLKHVLERGKSTSALEPSASPDTALQEAPEKLIEMLDFSIDKLNDNMKVAKEMLYNLSLDDRSSNDSFSNQTQYGERHAARWEPSDRLSARSAHASPRASGEPQRQQDYTPYGRDQAGSYGPGQGRPNSPNRTLPTLPSPPNITFKTSAGILPPMSPGVIGPNGQSPHTAHLQDLQHQLSTKSLAHQILQGEHEKLLSAYSRSQRKCVELDKKTQVSDTEINNLTEDRARLQSLIESLEQQVEELQQSRDEAHKQSVANGSQYMQIMAMSSKLQAQGSLDQKKWKADRDEWSTERDKLLAQIASLEKSAGSILKHDLSHTPRGAEGETEEAELSGMSFERLKEEIMSLRRSKRETESLVQAFKDEGNAIRQLTEQLSAAGERLTKIGAPEPMDTE